jgi:hypothetical protein
MSRPGLVVCLLAAALCAPRGLAQTPRAAIRAAKKADKKGIAKQNAQRLLQVERLSRMAPQDRERVLASLPPQRREIVERRLAQYEKMTPEERRRLRNQMGQWEDLPPERQQQVRRLYQRFQQMPPERRPLLQQELKALRAMGPQDRQARMNSDEFRNKYNPREQRFLGELARALEPDGE